MQPPQNPYNQPNYGQPQQPYAPAPQQPRGTVSLDVIGEAWKLVSANMGIWIGATVVYLLVQIVMSGLQRATQSTGPNGLPQSTPMSFLLSIVGIFVTQFFIAGLMTMALSTIRNGRAEFSQLTSGGAVLLPLVGAFILNAIIIGIGLVLCIVPGIIAMAGFMLITPIIVDKRAGAFGALGESWNAIKPHLGSALLLGIVLVLIVFASMIPCGLGLLVSLPLFQVSIALVYRDLFGIAGSSASNTGFTPPPIANPNF